MHIEYTACPHCHSSFSFRKPDTAGNCPWCNKCVWQTYENVYDAIFTESEMAKTIKALEADLNESRLLYKECKAKLERYETALKQYADPENWDESESTDLDLDDLWVGNSSQGYAVAQEALQNK